MIQLLLHKGADINAISGEFGTALQAAACEGHKAIVQLLIDNGADINIEGGEFGTALQAAVDQGHEGVVEILLINGARVNNDDGGYSNAFQVALYQGNETVAEILRQNGAEPSLQRGWLSSTLQDRDNRLPNVPQPAILSTAGVLREYLSKSDSHVDDIGIMRQQTYASEKHCQTTDEKMEVLASSSDPPQYPPGKIIACVRRAWQLLQKFARFIGPGMSNRRGFKICAWD